MKKIISTILVSVMIVSMLAVSASATKFITDTFDDYNEEIWSEDAYAVIDGCCEGFHEAVVHQTQYEPNEDEEPRFLEAITCPRTFTTGTDFLIEEDTSENPACGLWIADTYLAGEGLADDRNIFSFMYDANTSTFKLLMNTTDTTLKNEDLEPDAKEKVLGEWADPRELGQNMTNQKWINIGMKVEVGKLTCYVDGKAVITAIGNEVADVGKDPTPILYWNNGAHIMWDNFWIGDLAEFPDEVVTEAPVVTDAPVVTEPQTTAIVTELVTEIETKMAEVTDEEGKVVTDESGNKVTEVVTEIVTKYEEHVVTNAPAQDTQKQPTNPQGGAQTGDMAIIVVAVMVVALGSAVVVKKVNAK